MPISRHHSKLPRSTVYLLCAFHRDSHGGGIPYIINLATLHLLQLSWLVKYVVARGDYVSRTERCLDKSQERGKLSTQNTTSWHNTQCLHINDTSNNDGIHKSAVTYDGDGEGSDVSMLKQMRYNTGFKKNHGKALIMSKIISCQFPIDCPISVSYYSRSPSRSSTSASFPSYQPLLPCLCTHRLQPTTRYHSSFAICNPPRSQISTWIGLLDPGSPQCKLELMSLRSDFEREIARSHCSLAQC